MSLATASPARPARPGQVEVPLTAVQQRMFIAEGADCFRLPYLYPLPDDLGNAQVARRLRATLAAAPTLAATYHVDLATRTFTQRHDPRLADLDVPDVGIVDDLTAHLADRSYQPRLRTGGPVTARTLTHAGQRYLAVEFSHIALDGIGAVTVERLLFGGPPVEAPTPEAAFAAYRVVGQLEAAQPTARPISVLPPLPPLSPLPPLPVAPPRADRAVRRRGRVVPLDGVRRLARQLRVFPRIAVQAAAETALARHLPGCGYAAAATWRWQLGLRTAVGNYPALLTHQPPPDADLAARAAALLRDHAEPTIGPDQPIADTAAVVFSWEEFGYRHGRYVPVDSVARFGLYLRAVVHPDRVELTADTDPGLVEDLTAEAVLDHLVAVIAPDGCAAAPSAPLTPKEPR